MEFSELSRRLSDAARFRTEWLTDESHRSAFRLFNGFTEGIPELAVDVFAKTAVIHDYSTDGGFADNPAIWMDCLRGLLPFLKAVILKKRASERPAERNGQLVFGVKPDTWIAEHGVRYAVDLVLNRDDSFYCDTRLLRQWLIQNMRHRTVLNTFAYTGSLGAAAAAGGAEFVLQTDLSDKFLAMARRTASLNDFVFKRKNFMVGDFFPTVGKLRKNNRRFDCVILDPPFFSRTTHGAVDLAGDPLAVVNKVRPLVADGGWLVVVNNSLYLSGADFQRRLAAICDNRYLTWECTIPAPADFTGPAPDYLDRYAISPAPFNHPTKMVVLRVFRKDAPALEATE